MSSFDHQRKCIPVIYTQGTHYEVGFDIGRTFSSLIQSFLASSSDLNNTLIPLYKTSAGRHIYDDTLQSVTSNYPQYIREIQGTADGATVPFYKLFLLHLDRILSLGCSQTTNDDTTLGCTTVSCNLPGQVILGHTEDAPAEVLNHIYIVSAHIISETPQGRWNVKEERFTSLCYAGYLPGFTMSYNHHGFVFTVNIVSAKNLVPGKTPRLFLTRALLAAENFDQAEAILRDKGCGAGDGVSINMTFLCGEGEKVFHNVEVGPTVGKARESDLDIFTARQKEPIYHCNKYLRLKIPEVFNPSITSSTHRHITMDRIPKPTTKQDIINILGDTSDEEFPIFRSKEYVKTIVVGVFDFVARTWSIYMNNPKENLAAAILPIQLQGFDK